MKRKLFLICIFTYNVFISRAQSPTFEWVKGIGDSLSNDEGKSVVVDALGNVYQTGAFSGTVDFDPGVGTFNLTSIGWCRDVFVSKVDANGNFIWAKSFGGTDCDIGSSMVLDASGNIYITGTFDLLVSGYTDLFVCKLDNLGNTIWTKTIGIPNSSSVEGYAIAIDATGNVYTTGYFQTPIVLVDFDPGPGVVNLTAPSGLHEIFILKLDATGNFVWVKQMGGTSSDIGRGIAVDSIGNIYTTGSFSGTADFDPNAGVFNLTSLGSENAFVSKLDASGNFIWAKNTGATLLSACPFSINLDGSNNVYTSGYFKDTADFDPGIATYNLISNMGAWDIFISKLDSSGNLVWAKSMGGNSNDISYSIKLDTGSNVYTTGYFIGTADFDPGPGVFNLNSPDLNGDMFISKLDNNGNFVWAKGMDGSVFSSGYSISVDEAKNVYVTGTYTGTVDFDPDAGIVNLTSTGYMDVFVEKFSQGPNGIIENVVQNNVLIYPNPSFGNFNLSGLQKGNSIEVYGALGQLIYQTIANSDTQTIDLSRENSAIYFVRITSDKGIITKRIVKQ